MAFTRNQMIEFMATVDGKSMSHVTTMLTGFETDEIEPIMETMINENKERMRENIAIAI